jgi:GAF domain-containing protein
MRPVVLRGCDWVAGRRGRRWTSGVQVSASPSDDGAADVFPGAVLAEPNRLRSLAETGLRAESDPAMEAFAERVRQRLRVPVALVSLVSGNDQVFPGMAGLPEPWASRRSTPLTHSFCQHVVVSAEPLIVSDARDHPLVCDNLAVPDLGVIAYAGLPLTDAAGNVLGSLCAIDIRPRRWTSVELDALGEIAGTCSTELRLRLARVDADVERERRDQLEQRLRRSFDQSQALLNAAQSFADTATVEDVRTRVSELVVWQLRPSYVGLVLLDEWGRLRRLHDDRFPPGAEDVGPWAEYDLRTRLPTATAARERRLVVYTDRASYDADHGEPARQLLRALGLHAVVVAPLLDAHGAMGSVALGWDAPRSFDPSELLTVTTIAGFAARALDRARRLQHRDSVAHQLQQAMLTTLPQVSGVVMAARYQPADSREQVGGDWYDAAPLPDRNDPDGRDLAVSVGDIIGHNLDAAMVMGQVRSMLRQAAWDHPGERPSHTLVAFELAAAGLALDATGTALLAHLHRGRDRRWTMTWTNAGHPPPVLICPDEPAALLDGHDVLFGFPALRGRPRHDQCRELPPGSTLFLYSDGLVEKRGSDIDAGTETLLGLLDAHRDASPQDIVDTAVDTLAVDAPDDVVAFAIRVL